MSNIHVRPAKPEDADLIVRLVKELAAFEQAPDGTVRLTAADVQAYAFGPHPRFEVLIGELGDKPEGILVFYEVFSTWTAKPSIHIEDFYLRPAARGQGLGRAIMASLVAVAEGRGCGRLGLQVLDWNPARKFYERIGFSHYNQWLIYRLDQAELANWSQNHLTFT